MRLERPPNMRFQSLPFRVALAAIAATVVLIAQTDRTLRVENGLSGPISIDGKIQTFTLSERLKHHNVPGVSIAVLDGGKVVWARGYGTTGEGSIVDADTLFQAASISKPVAAMTALRLVELGKLSLDEDVNVKLKSWKVPDSPAMDGEKVTLRRLLSHTAGLTVHGFPGYSVDVPVPTLPQLLNGEKPANTAAVRVDLKPGTKYRYSGGGYEVMQQLVEDVTGRPFPAVAEEFVLKPLSMKNSTYLQPLPPERLKSASAGHNGKGEVIPGKRHTYPEMAAAGLWTTPSDLAKVILEIQSPGRILKPATVATMLTEVLSGYALGFGVKESDGRQAFSHGGSNQGFRCNLFAYRSPGQGAVVMTNGDRGSPLADEIMRAIATEYRWPDFRPRDKKKIILSEDVLKTYVGTYTFQGGNIQLLLEGGALHAQVPNGTRIPLIAEGAGKFFSPMGGAPDLTIQANAEGKLELRGGNIVAVRQ